MKSLKAISLLSILALFILFTSCDKYEEVADTNNIEKEGLDELPDLAQLIDPIISEPDIEINIELINDGLPEKLEEGFNENYAFHGRKKLILKNLFDTLNLSKEQIIKLKYTYKQHHDCQYRLHLQLRKLNQQIIDKAIAYKKELYIKYKKGNMTKAELDKALRVLHERTKKAIRENPERKRIIEGLKKCHKNFIENIRLILNRNQWAILIDYYKRLRYLNNNLGGSR